MALTAAPDLSVYFLLRFFDEIADCERRGGSWMIGHDGTDLNSIAATRFPMPRVTASPDSATSLAMEPHPPVPTQP